jgi:hypothetical protein
MNRPWLVVCASIAAGLVIYLAGAILERRSGNGPVSNESTVLKACSVIGPLPLVVWQAMVVSRSWRWLTGAASAVATFWFGHWLQGLYGLDPPYIYFVLGMGLQIEGTAIAAATAVGFIASRISHVVRGR